MELLEIGDPNVAVVDGHVTMRMTWYWTDNAQVPSVVGPGQLAEGNEAHCAQAYAVVSGGGVTHKLHSACLRSFPLMRANLNRRRRRLGSTYCICIIRHGEVGDTALRCGRS